MCYKANAGVQSSIGDICAEITSYWVWSFLLSLSFFYRWYVGKVLDQPLPILRPLSRQAWYWRHLSDDRTGQTFLMVAYVINNQQLIFISAWRFISNQISCAIWFLARDPLSIFCIKMKIRIFYMADFRAGKNCGCSRKQKSSLYLWTCRPCFLTSGQIQCS